MRRTNPWLLSYRLRTLALLLCVAGGVFAIVGYRVRRQQTMDVSFAKLRENGIGVTRSYYPDEIILSFPSSFGDADLRRAKPGLFLADSLGLPMRVSLDSTEITDDGLKHLGGLKNITFLGLPRHMSDLGLTHLAELESLESLDLSGCQIRGEGLASIGHLKALARLRLVNSRIGDEGMRHLTGLVSLMRLELRHTDITDDGLRSVGRIESLMALDLSFTKVTGAGMTHLSGLTELRELNLQGTRIDNEGLRSLLPLALLEDLWLIDTEITDAGLLHYVSHRTSQPRRLHMHVRSPYVTPEGVRRVQPNPRIRIFDYR